MTFIISAIVIYIGLTIFSFAVSNIILILFLGIPFTKNLEKINILKKNKIIIKYIYALFFQIAILSILTITFYIYFFNSYFISLIIGYVFGVMGVISCIKQFGLNSNNFSDYLKSNNKYFNEEIINKYIEDEEGLLEFIKLQFAKNRS